MKKTNDFPFSGLTNKNDSSYINVVLQCLSVNHSFLQELVNDKETLLPLDTLEKKLCMDYINISSALKDLRETLNPVSFKKSIAALFLNDKNPEEVLAKLLGVIGKCFSKKVVRIEANPLSSLHYKDSQKEMESYNNFEKNIVSNTFGGQYIKKITCSGCMRKTYTYKPFLNILLYPRRNCYTTDLINEKFLKDYVPQECPNCTHNSDIEHSEETMIYSLPKTLILSLEIKGGITVGISETLDLGEHSFSNTDESVNYRLSSVIYETSTSKYFCVCRRKSSYFKINDTLISEETLEDCVSSFPCVVFYDRC